MLLGALMDLGVSVDDLRTALGELLPAGASLEVGRAMRSGISAATFRVLEPTLEPGEAAHHHHRHLKAIDAMIDRTAMAPHVKARAKELYGRLARVEADIHQTSLERVHLHEVGALDSVVDIVGAVWALDALGVSRVVASPMNVGSGRVQTEHGLLSVPAPATTRLLEGAVVFSDGTPFEMVTPTGALLVTGYAESFGSMPPMRVARSGYGAGGRDIPGHPNVLRAILGEAEERHSPARVAVIECNIDDTSPQVFGAVMDLLYARGALEVFYTPVVMKKSRPGTLVTVIAPVAQQGAMLDLLFAETSTIGVRFRESDRECLARETVTVATPYGDVRVKVARRGGIEMNAAPEFDDCAARAREHGVAVRVVQAAARRAYDDGQSRQ
jgi:uncharacterized protein (TIGR00299 family) protein